MSRRSSTVLYNVSVSATTYVQRQSFSGHSSGSGPRRHYCCGGDSDICGVFMQRQQERFVFVLGKSAYDRVHPFGGYKASKSLELS